MSGSFYALYHPIPLGYPASHGGGHFTGGIKPEGTRYFALDFFPGAGAPVLAVQGGTIDRTSGHEPSEGEVDCGVYGLSIYLNADSGTNYYYTHLGKVTVMQGQYVRPGDVVGKVGRWIRPVVNPCDTGKREDKTHLHLGAEKGPVSIWDVARAPRIRP